MSEPRPIEAVERLRRFRRALDKVDLPECDWAMAALDRYLAQAAEGETLDEAFGTRPRPGGRAWPVVEAQRARDQLLRRVAREYLGGLSRRDQADRLASDASRYRQGSWRFEQHLSPPDVSGPATRRALLRAAFHAADVPVSAGRIYKILSDE